MQAALAMRNAHLSVQFFTSKKNQQKLQCFNKTLQANVVKLNIKQLKSAEYKWAEA